MALLPAASASSSALLRRIAAARSSLSSGQALVKGQRRGMALGGHHGPPPEWTGVDKVVRGYFPEDYQLAIAILSGYGGLVVLYKIKSAITSKPAPKQVAAAAPAAAASTDSGDDAVPSVESPAFEKYVESDSFYKLLEDEVKLAKVVESM